MTLAVMVKRAAHSLIGDATSMAMRVLVTFTNLMAYYLRFCFNGEVNDTCGSHVDTKRTLKRGGAMLTV